MKHFSLVLIFSFAVISAESSVAQDTQPVDEIIARGSIQTDPAMSAWNSGDFATAEIEFDKNAFCALRAERNFASGIEAARDNSITANVAADAVGPPQVTGGQGGVSITSAAPAPTAQFNSSSFKNKESATKRTCEDRGFQLYMKGLSQLKLGKREKAKESLSRAADMRKNLYDAHFRLALLEYQDGNIEKANKQFKKLRKLQSRYKKGDANKEIKAQIKYLKSLLG